VKYKIVENPAVTAAIGRAFDIFERADDAINTLTEVLAQEPKLAGFPTDEDPNIYWIKIPGRPSIKFPKVYGLYSIVGETVTIHSIRIEHDGVIFHSAAFER